ncbi:hypothetical protein pb186bvf_014707 [Paramecium bursaria]
MFDLAIKLNANNAIIYYNKGNSLYNLERYQEAIQMYNEVIKLNPDDIEAYIYKGFLLLYNKQEIHFMSLKRYQESIEAYDQVNLFKIQKDTKKLQNMYDQAIKLDPKYNYSQKEICQLLVQRMEDNEFTRNTLIVLFCLLLILLFIFRNKL